MPDSPSNSGLPAGLDQLSDNALTSAFSGLMDSIQGHMNDAVNEATSFTAAVTQDKSGIQARSDAQQDITAATAAAQSKSLAAQRSAAADFGANPDAQNYVMRAMADDIISTQGKYDQLTNEIYEMQGKTLLNDPMGYFEGLFSLPAMVSQANTLENKMAVKEQAISKLQDSTTKQQQIVATDNQLDALTTLSAEKKLIAAKATSDAAVADEKLAQFNMNITDLTNRMGVEKFQAAISLNSSVIQQQELQIRKDMLKLEQGRELYYDALKEEQIEKLRTYKASRQSWKEQLDKIAPYIGQSMDVDQYNRLVGPYKDVIDKIIMSYDPISHIAFPDTASAIVALRNTPINLGPGMEPIRQKLNNELTAIAANPANVGKKPAELEGILQTQFAAEWKREINNIPEEGGIYSAPPLQTSINASGDFQTTALYKALQPLAVNPRYNTRADDVIAAANNLVKSGGMSPAQAAQQVSMLYQSIMTKNNQLHDYGKLTIPGMGGKTVPGFRTTINSPENGIQQVLDMSSQAAVESYLTREAIFRKSMGLITPPAGNK